MGNPFRGILRIIMVVGWIAIGVMAQIVLCAFKLPQRRTLPVFFHRVLTRHILGLKVTASGTISTHAPTLFTCNHLSYLDILAIASLTPCSFVSKADVAKWPVFGLLAKLQGTVFIERKRLLTREQSSAVEEMLGRKEMLVIYPEGTSSEGLTVLPFKSSLLQSVFGKHQKDIMIQPVAISCTQKDGLAHLYPWYADMTLVDHLWKIVWHNGFEVHLAFLPSVPASQFTDRKALAEYARRQIMAAPHGVINP